MNPYSPPPTGSIATTPANRVIDLGTQGIIAFSSSLLVACLLQSQFWEKSFKLYPINDRAYLIALFVSLGIAMAACIAQLLGRITSNAHAPVLIMAGIISLEVIFLREIVWPFSAGFVHYDLINVMSLYLYAGAVPATLLSLPYFVQHSVMIAFVCDFVLAVLFAYISCGLG